MDLRVVPDGVSETDPSLGVTVHSVRVVSDNLRILLLVTNNDDQQAVVMVDPYVNADWTSTVYAESDGIALPICSAFQLNSVQGCQGRRRVSRHGIPAGGGL